MENTIVDHEDVIGASPVGAAPTTSSFSTEQLASMYWEMTTARQDGKDLSFGIWCASDIKGFTVSYRVGSSFSRSIYKRYTAK